MPSTYVVDASVVGAWLLPDEESAAADKVFDRLAEDDPVAPGLLVHEIRNILLMAERRGRIEEDDVITALVRFNQIGIQFQDGSGHSAVIQLARRHGLSAYDAIYLTLASENNWPLATLDKKLRAAATKESVELVV